MYIVLSFIYIYYCRKTFGEHCDIQIAIDYEMKFKNYFTSSFWLNLFEFIVRYVYIIYLHSHKSPWLSRLERHSSKPEVVGSNPAVGKNFSFCNSRSLRVADTSNQSIQMKSTVAYT